MRWKHMLPGVLMMMVISVPSDLEWGGGGGVDFAEDIWELRRTFSKDDSAMRQQHPGVSG